MNLLISIIYSICLAFLLTGIIEMILLAIKYDKANNYVPWYVRLKWRALRSINDIERMIINHRITVRHYLAVRLHRWNLLPGSNKTLVTMKYNKSAQFSHSCFVKSVFILKLAHRLQGITRDLVEYELPAVELKDTERSNADMINVTLDSHSTPTTMIADNEDTFYDYDYDVAHVEWHSDR